MSSTGKDGAAVVVLMKIVEHILLLRHDHQWRDCNLQRCLPPTFNARSIENEGNR